MVKPDSFCTLIADNYEFPLNTKRSLKTELLADNCDIKAVMVSSRQAQHEVMKCTPNLATENYLICIFMNINENLKNEGQTIG